MNSRDTDDESFVIHAACRVRLPDPAHIYALARDVVELCAGAADLGGALPQMLEKVSLLEPLEASQHEFAVRICEWCANIALRHLREGGVLPSEVIRTRFGFLDTLVLEGLDPHELWSCANPMSYMATLHGYAHLTEEQRVLATTRFLDAIAAEIGDNNDVVAAFEDAREADPASPQAQRWAQAVALATACGLAGLAADPSGGFEVFTHYT